MDDADCPDEYPDCQGAQQGDCVNTSSCTINYITKTGDCVRDQSPTCEVVTVTREGECEAQSCDLPRCMSCETEAAEGKSLPGVCKDKSQCQGVQYCSTTADSGPASGQCALPFSGPGRYNESFQVDPKGNYL
ncbi:MAG: hypothetical protein ABEN55_21825, partial [Bradymonadaceae bacterium]